MSERDKLTPEILQTVLDRLAEGRSLRSICRDEDIPVQSSAIRMHMVRNPDSPFCAQYARARELGLHETAEELNEIADDGSNDYMTKRLPDGREIEVVNHEHIARSRLRVDTRKWYLSKIAPKLYGDKVQTDITNSDGSFAAIGNMSEEEINHKVALILKAAEHRKMKAESQDADIIEDNSATEVSPEEDKTREELLDELL